MPEKGEQQVQDLKETFLTRLEASFNDGSFAKLTLGHPADSSSALRKLLFRPVMIRGEKQCAVVSRFTTRDETKNYSFPEALALVRTKLESAFLSANLFSKSEEVQLELSPKAHLRVKQAKHEPATLEHDRTKSRWVDAQAPYLAALGVTDATGKVRMSDKFRQIERFLDLLSSAVRAAKLASDSPAEAESSPLSFCDMGAGKGYLTFAAYDYLCRIGKREVHGTGVESRPDLVDLCNTVAEKSGFTGLKFVQSTISQFEHDDLDILIALHACNTATDDALAAGVRAGASVILAAPCCHKEIRPQVDAGIDHGPLRDVLRHGIFAERHAEMATDALRALLLERAGYRVTVSEFVSAEHTAKNVMIIATKRAEGGAAGVINRNAEQDLDQRIAQLKKFYGIRHHRLEELFME